MNFSGSTKKGERQEMVSYSFQTLNYYTEVEI